jgi:hypothetical protein
VDKTEFDLGDFCLSYKFCVHFQVRALLFYGFYMKICKLNISVFAQNKISTVSISSTPMDLSIMLYMTFSLRVIIICISVPLERAIVMKEQFNNWYKLRTYYMALTLSSIPVQVSDIFTLRNNVVAHKLRYIVHVRMKKPLPRCGTYIPRNR